MTSAPAPMPDRRRHTSGVVDAFLRSPVSGIAAWVVMSVFSGPGRFEDAVSAALGIALLVSWVGHRRGVPVHPLDAFGVAFFAVLAGVGLLASPGVIQTMELWAGEIANVALAGFAAATLIVRRPFTLAYARDATPPEVWDSPVFRRVNYVITGVWAAAFLFSAAVGCYGDAVLRNPDDFWTGWILQLGATLFAIAFTDFYPDYAEGRAAVVDRAASSEVPADGLEQPVVNPPSAVRLVDWLPTFTLITGIAGLVTNSVSMPTGCVLIAVGILGSAGIRWSSRRAAWPRREPIE